LLKKEVFSLEFLACFPNPCYSKLYYTGTKMTKDQS